MKIAESGSMIEFEVAEAVKDETVAGISDAAEGGV